MPANNDKAINHAPIYFNQQGTPVSSQFDDIYFNSENGLAESQYVFLQGNDLTERWQQANRLSQSHFVIGETGFGTGLNFLLSCLLHKTIFDSKDNQHIQNHHLHFISFEKYPLSGEDIKASLKCWPQLQEPLRELLAQYPTTLTGCHRLIFAQGKITLDLHLGDINEQMPTIFTPDEGLVDAWFLDGFAPSKNNSMWNDHVFNHMQRLSKHQATVATFSCARLVKDGLTGAGFVLSKRKGFGKKREMLCALLEDKKPIERKLPFYFRAKTNINNSAPVAIIGGGIASASLSYALALHGINSDIICQDKKLGQGASKNRQGALYPLLQADDNALSEFYAHSFLFARRQYQSLIEQGFGFDHNFCGVLLQNFDDKTAKQQQSLENSGLWQSLYQKVDGLQASKLAQIELPFGGHFIEQGGWISPQSLINAYIKAANSLANVNCVFDYQITSLTQQSDSTWVMNQNSAKQKTYQTVVICAGFDSSEVIINDSSSHGNSSNGIDLSPIRGQVSHLPRNEHTDKLATVLCNQGYTTPSFQGIHCTGASFIKGDTSTNLRDKEHLRNLERFASGFGGQPWLSDLSPPTDGQVATRCVSIDHLPIVGAMPETRQYQHIYQDLWKGFKVERYERPKDYDNLFILTALGARGLCSAPLCANILAAQMTNSPYPVSERVLNALNPGRGLIKKLKAKN